MRIKCLALFLLVLCTLLLSGCSGFQPRTANSVLTTPLLGERISLSKSGLDTNFLAVLRKGLQESGAQLVSESTPGAIILTISQLDEDKTVSAYSSVRQVREFNHYTDLNFSARRQTTQSGKPKLSPQASPFKVRAERTQIYDSRYVLGVSEEEADIRNELRAEVVRLLTLKLASL